VRLSSTELTKHYQVHLPLDPASKTPKGFAYITFVNPEDAVSAYTALDKRSFQGRLLHILPAVDRHPKAADEDGKARGVKAERGAQRKAAAGREFNWAMLYMNVGTSMRTGLDQKCLMEVQSDAVASSIADRLNVSKADILNPDETDGVNPAVKLALAETHVIAETKAYLEANGCDLGAFAAPGARRSDSALLVKNIPYGTGEPALRELFEPHGALRRVLVPPAGTMAIVEFVRADEAGHAFRAVAYRRLGNAVVYLEKAPAGLLPEGDFAPPVKADADAETEEQGKPPAQTEEAAPGATLFVKNLAFATTTEQLVAALRQLPGFAFARVQMKPDATGQKRLSMGYGFAGFRTVEDATRAQRAVQGMVLGGHALEAKFAGRGREDEERQAKKEKGGKATTTKMIVKNLPFEANKKDIRALFRYTQLSSLVRDGSDTLYSAHGQLKSVRLPKRLDHRARGFAFLEFLTRQEAEAAYDALRHTHLLGRHLVLEWADEGEQDVDALRAKAGVGFGGGKEMPGRKRKLNMDADGDEPMEDED
jgi:multiple RNA-binding domain-containing protein 1